MKCIVIAIAVDKTLFQLQSNLGSSNIFVTMEMCSRYRTFEPLRVNHSARLETNGNNGHFFNLI